MQQLSKARSVFYHLYPGVIITACFIALTPIVLKYQYQPQFGLLMAIAIAAIPIFIIHLSKIKTNEHTGRLERVNGFRHTLPAGKLILYIFGLVTFAFIIWGAMQPLNEVIAKKLFSWLPYWYRVQDFTGYGKEAILVTLILNLLLNGIIAPVIEEYYFRGYLLPRMAAWGKWAFALNAVLFSLYHFWQPYIWLTLIISILPMTWLVWKTRDLRVGIYTHCLLNLIGALLSFGIIYE